MNRPKSSESFHPEQQTLASDSMLPSVAEIVIDQQQRWQHGDRVRVNTYLESQPKLKDDTNALAALVQNEIRLRREYGDEPKLSDYLESYPQLTAHLAQPVGAQRAGPRHPVDASAATFQTDYSAPSHAPPDVNASTDKSLGADQTVVSTEASQSIPQHKTLLPANPEGSAKEVFQPTQYDAGPPPDKASQATVQASAGKMTMRADASPAPLPQPPKAAPKAPQKPSMTDLLETRHPDAVPEPHDPAATRQDGVGWSGFPITERGSKPTGLSTVHPSDAPPAPRPRPSPPGDLTARGVPGYEILGELGRGGMGVVYKARQIKANRLVALKMILQGAHAREGDLKRFRVEGEAVARLHHPNIVQIYEVGEHDGAPFFSLEFLPGGSLDKKLNGTPLPPRDAATLMEKLASAMQHAHENGIIHRDLKPANILLHESPPKEAGAKSQESGKSKGGASSSLTPESWLLTPKITDFGLAKFLEVGESGQTHTGAVMGTPSYMAPEQALGRTRHSNEVTDVYSLGAILYELLTGRPPFRGTTVMDTLQQVVSSEPVPPSRLQMKLPRDLETICLKCLEKEPQRRYTTAGAVADDLLAFLKGEPIKARPAGRVERALKWSRRHPAAAALVGVIAAALTVVSLGGWVATVQISEKEKIAQQEKEAARVAEAAAIESEKEKEKQRADAEAARANEQKEKERANENFTKAETARANEQKEKERANENFAKAETARIAEEKAKEAEKKERKRAEDLFVKAEENFRVALKAVEEMLTEVGAVDLAEVPQMEEVRKKLLQKALVYYTVFLQNRGEDPAVRFEAAQARIRSGEIHEMLGEHGVAEQAFEKAIPVLAELKNNFPDKPDYRRELARAYHQLGILLKKNTRYIEAEKQLREALKLREQLAKETEKDADKGPEYRGDAESSRYHLAAVLARFGSRDKEAEETYRLVLGRQQELAKQYADKADFSRQLARTYNNLGMLLENSSKPEAAKLFADAADLQEKLLADARKATPEQVPPGLRWELARTYNNLAKVYRDQKTPQKAAGLYVKSRELLQKLTTEFPKVPDYHHELATVYHNLGRLEYSTRAFDDAEKEFQIALDIRRRLTKEFPTIPDYQQKLARILLENGILLEDRKRLADAEKLYREAEAIQRGLVKDFPKVPDYLSGLGETLNYLARLQLARGEAEQDRVRAQTDFTEAEKTVREAITQHEEARKLAPGQVLPARLLRDDYFVLALIERRLESHTELAKAAQELPRCLPEPSEHLAASQFLAACVTLVDKDVKMPEAQRQPARDAYARQVVAQLEEALKKGFKDPKELTNPVYDPLRQRDDFKKIVTEVDKRAKAAAG